MAVTRRGLQIALGVLWLMDGILQLQPSMFTSKFADEVLRPAAAGQPVFVAAPVHAAAAVVTTHPVATNATFATVQLLLGLGLLWRRTARAALCASVVWSLAVWLLGEGLGGLFSGHAMLLNGAPGAVLLYAVAAGAAYAEGGRDGRGEVPCGWIVGAWVALWAGGALLQLLPGQNTGREVSAALSDGVESGPAWAHGAGNVVSDVFAQHGWLVLVLVVAQVAIAVSALGHRGPRLVSVVAGSALAAAFWVFGQGMGELTSGTSTDPNSGPLLVLLALAVAGHVAREESAPTLPAVRRVRTAARSTA